MESKKRDYKKVKNTNESSQRSKRICIPIDGKKYKEIIDDTRQFRNYIDIMIKKHPEIFPSSISEGYKFYGLLPESKKMKGVRLRRIKLKTTQAPFTIAPSFILPYMTGTSNEVEKALFLRRFNVPYWGLSYVFGKSDMHWYRLENRIGHNSIVGTTVKASEKLPKDLIADEKHSKENKDKIYIATTASNECVLGAAISSDAGTDNLEDAYKIFKNEAENVSPNYKPDTVNIDGWNATKASWKRLFPSIAIILCFLHGYIKIRDRCRHMKIHFYDIGNRVWEIYHAPNKQTFRNRINGLKKWSKGNLTQGAGLEAILKLCAKAGEYVKSYDHPSAHRTSNMLDRIMDRHDRYIYSCKYFHGNRQSSEYSVRAWAILFNFWPYCPRTNISSEFQSAAHKLNGFVYRSNWLENLLVSSSMGGYRC